MEHADVPNNNKEKRGIRVAIADDHRLLTEGLRSVLERFDEVEIVGEASDAFAAMQLVIETAPHVLLLDTALPKKDGLDLIRELGNRAPDTHILILDRDMNPHHAFRIFRAGAKGFIPSAMDSNALVHAISQVAGGRIYLPDELKDTFAEWFLRPDGDKSPEEVLSNREFQVMRRLALGDTNHEIVARLHISVKTVDTHRANLLKKLRLRNNSDITRFAIRHGFIKA